MAPRATPSAGDEWVPPDCPDISQIELWDRFNPPWLDGVVSRPVDHLRTQELHELDLPVRVGINQTRGGKNWGVPFQRLDTQPTAKVKVWEASKPPIVQWWPFKIDLFPAVTVPLPDRDKGGEYVRTLGDPNPVGTDAQAFFLDPIAGRYYELSAFGPSPIWPPGRPWRAGTVAVWDLNKDWAVQRTGISGARLPILPMLPTFEEYEAGYIGHAMHWAAAGYASDEWIAPARSTDGRTPGHPLRAGARLRMAGHARDRILATKPHPHVMAFVECACTFGFIVDDYTDPAAGDLTRQPQDHRIQVPDLGLRRTDFVILA